MRQRITSPSLSLFASLSLIAAVAAFSSAAPAQSSKQQVVYLPDPTPRPPDLQLKLKTTSQAGVSTQEAAEHQKQKRRELVVWASDELVTLTERMQADLAGPRTDTSSARAAANAEKIEQLARNLTAALKAQ